MDVCVPRSIRLRQSQLIYSPVHFILGNTANRKRHIILHSPGHIFLQAAFAAVQFPRYTASGELLRRPCAGVIFCAEGGRFRQIEAVGHCAEFIFCFDDGDTRFLAVVDIAGGHTAHYGLVRPGTVLDRNGLDFTHQAINAGSIAIHIDGPTILYNTAFSPVTAGLQQTYHSASINGYLTNRTALYYAEQIAG